VTGELTQRRGKSRHKLEQSLRRSTPVIVDGERRGVIARAQIDKEHWVKSESLGTARARNGFLKTDYGHTRQSTVHVRCTPDREAQNWICALPAGAPDIAQCSVQCTPECPVSSDKGNFKIF
jgi:hypothetical protein